MTVGRADSCDRLFFGGISGGSSGTGAGGGKTLDEAEAPPVFFIISYSRIKFFLR